MKKKTKDVIVGKLEEITPAMAEELLKKTEDRPVRSTIARNSYELEMKRGNWKIVGDTIKLSPDGKVVDGIMRLSACKRSGVTIKAFIAYNVDPEDRIYIDQGVKYPIWRELPKLGYKHSKDIPSVVKMVLKMRNKKASINIYDIMGELDMNGYEYDNALGVVGTLYNYMKAKKFSKTELAAKFVFLKVDKGKDENIIANALDKLCGKEISKPSITLALDTVKADIQKRQALMDKHEKDFIINTIINKVIKYEEDLPFPNYTGTVPELG